MAIFFWVRPLLGHIAFDRVCPMGRILCYGSDRDGDSFSVFLYIVQAPPLPHTPSDFARKFSVLGGDH